jgi:hypothetical protein
MNSVHAQNLQDANRVLNSMLEPNERLLWSGRPEPGLVFQPGEIFAIPFSILWGGFAIFWETTAFVMGAPAFFLLFGSLFVVIGLYMMFGRFIVDARRRANTIYGITNKRALIHSNGWRQSTRSLVLKAVSELNITDRSNGRKTITFGSPSWFPRNWPMAGNGFQSHSPAFEGVENGEHVLAILRKAQESI